MVLSSPCCFPLENMAGTVSIRVQDMSTSTQTKTKASSCPRRESRSTCSCLRRAQLTATLTHTQDNVFVTVKSTMIYKVPPERAKVGYLVCVVRVRARGAPPPALPLLSWTQRCVVLHSRFPPHTHSPPSGCVL